MSLLQCLRSYAVSREFNLGSAAEDFLKLNYFHTFWFPVSLQNIIEKSTKNGDCIFGNYFRDRVCGFF